MKHVFTSKFSVNHTEMGVHGGAIHDSVRRLAGELFLLRVGPTSDPLVRLEHDLASSSQESKNRKTALAGKEAQRLSWRGAKD